MKKRYISLALIAILVGSVFFPRSAHADSQTFTSNGTFTVPTNVTTILVEMQGDGGAAGYGPLSGGGGGGAYTSVTLSVTPGHMYSVTVGQGGQPNVGNDGSDGAGSSFDIYNAPGGFGGQSGANGGNGGAESNTGNGDTNYFGGAGGNQDGVGSGGGGGGAGSSGNGGDAAGETHGSGAPLGGDGADGGINTSGTAGNAYGGGGGGALGNGGAGAPGSVTITWTVNTVPTVTTDSVGSITTTLATPNGTITATGGVINDKRGFVYGTVSQSLPGNVAPGSSGYASFSETSGSYGVGSYSIGLTGLTLGTQYFVRAYSHNSIGYSYGNELNFTTENQSGNFLSNGLIGYWPFNTKDYLSASSVADKSNNGGTCSTAQGATTQVVGKVSPGQAWSFSGSNNYATVPASSLLNGWSGNAITISVWVYSKDLSQENIMAQRVGCGAQGNWQLYKQVNNGGGAGWYFDFWDTGLTNRECFSNVANKVRTWQMVTVTYNGSAMVIYVDGSPIKTCAQTGVTMRSASLQTDFANETCGSFFNGYLDDSRIYNRALSAVEVNQLWRWSLSKRNSY